MQHFHLTVVIVVILTGSATVGNRLVHLVAGIHHSLHIFLLQILLGELGGLVVGIDLATGEDRLRELADELQQQFTGIDESAIVRPSGLARQCDAGIEGSAGGLHVIEGFLDEEVGQADVGTALEHHGRHADLQEPLLEHTVAFGGRVVLSACCPMGALDVLRRDAEQAADLILCGMDGAADGDYLDFHVEPRRLLLVDGR